MISYKVNNEKMAWHSKEEKYYAGGEAIPLSHLSDGEIANLIRSGLIVEVKNEVNHKKSDIGEKND